MQKSSKRLEDFSLHWKNYVFQVFFATVATFIVLVLLNLNQAIIVASIGSTAFIVFAMPQYLTAKARNIMGGYAIGLTVGSICSIIPQSSYFQFIMFSFLAVGLSIFLMIITDTEHPPASGATLAIAISGFSLKVVLAAMASVSILSLIHHVFKRHLRDLT